MAIIVSDTAQIIIALASLLSVVLGFVISIMTLILNGKVENVIRATDGLKTELVAEVRASSLKAGQEQGVAQEAAKRDDHDAAHAAGKAEGLEQGKQT